MRSFIIKNISYLLRWNRSAKTTLLVFTDLLILIGCLYLASAIHQENIWPIEYLYTLWPLLALVGPAFILLLIWFGLYHNMVRYGGVSLFVESFKGVTSVIILTKLLTLFFIDIEVRLEILTIFWAFLLLGTHGSRLMAKWIIEVASGYKSNERDLIAVFGAGKAGVTLVNAFERNLLVKVVCFFDDDPKLSGRKAKGRPIFHTRDLVDQVRTLKIKQIIVGIASLSRQGRKEVLHKLEKVGVRVRVLPGMNDLIEGKISLSQVRDVNASDLLWRASHKPDKNLIKKDVSSRSVMVTGGGGSIGSELCRQAIKNGVKSLVIIEHSEYSLYTIDQELTSLSTSLGKDVEIIPILGDVSNEVFVERVIRAYRVQTIYHAAAYKHVPMVEFNTCEGVRNNVFGTYATAKAAQKAGVEKFVLISTDKAVRPTNVMGASKRLSEMVLQALQGEKNNFKTKFTMVRFGNVLDSAGSVVPLFRKQIKHGGPVTLTHKDVTRYFMTIPEAAQLVLQAGAMAVGGEVFLLDMGEPVKIYDLASKMISLSGFSVADGDNPDGDIEIRVIGMRPGEKLYEELFITDNILGTLHPSILRAQEQFIESSQLNQSLKELNNFIQETKPDEVRATLKFLVEGYTPGIDPISVNQAHTSNLKLIKN